MTRQYDKRLRALEAARDPALLRQGLRGVERETLRVTPTGHIAATGHPQSLGAALTNRYITTDYSEALLELITPPQADTPSTLTFLRDIHQFTLGSLGEELLWPFSMPCRLRGEEDIPIAAYGTSNVAQFKMAYRRGLGHRYGRYMQAIAGVHFNYSLPDAFWPFWAELEDARGDLRQRKSDAYLAVVRNVRRLDWLLLYLFGASPAICKCFLTRGSGGLEELDPGSWYAPWATSLRMSDIGYKNESQAGLWVSANSLEEYIADLTTAIRTPHAAFAGIGVKVDGEYRQLSTNLLQIGAEYYSTIRPKRSALSGERPTAALRRGGIEYVELRTLDLDPYAPTGVNETELRFAEIFLLYNLLLDSPPIVPAERPLIGYNHGAVARRGREPGLELRRGERTVRLRDWALEMLRDMAPLAELLGDQGSYSRALADCIARVEEPDRCPSALALAGQRRAGLSLADYGLQLAQQHRATLAGLQDADNPHFALLEVEAQASLDRQCWIEEHDTLDFDEYLAAYFA